MRQSQFCTPNNTALCRARHNAVTMRLYIAAARSPPRSEPQNSHDLRPRAIPRKYWRCHALLTAHGQHPGPHTHSGVPGRSRRKSSKLIRAAIRPLLSVWENGPGASPKVSAWRSRNLQHRTTDNRQDRSASCPNMHETRHAPQGNIVFRTIARPRIILYMPEIIRNSANLIRTI